MIISRDLKYKDLNGDGVVNTEDGKWLETLHLILFMVFFGNKL